MLTLGNDHIGGFSNDLINDAKLLWLDRKDITHVHVSQLLPLVFTEVGLLCELAVLAPHFENAAGALAQLRIIVAFLGDVSIGPQPESTMHLYIVNILGAMHKGKRTAVAPRTSAVVGK